MDKKVILKSICEATLNINCHGVPPLVFEKKGSIVELDINMVPHYKEHIKNLIDAKFLEMEIVEEKVKSSPKKELVEKPKDESSEAAEEVKEVKGKGKGK